MTLDRRENDIQFGQLIQKVDDILSTQGEMRIELKEVSEKTNEMYYAFKKDEDTKKIIKGTVIKKIFDAVQYVGTAIIALYLYLKG